MAILIKDRDTDRIVRELAARTGETITDAVKHAAQERLNRLPPPQEPTIAERYEQALAYRRARLGPNRPGSSIDREALAEFLAKLDCMPRINEHLTDDEIMGYNDEGHFD